MPLSFPYPFSLGSANDVKSATHEPTLSADKEARQPITKNIHLYANIASLCIIVCYNEQESPAVADKPARRLRTVCTVYVRAVGL